MIKYLANGDELAGVMGHEIAHADLRHSTDALTRQYGYQLMLDVLLGRNSSMLKQIALGMSSLSYSRKNEEQADEYSVRYLKSTNYNCGGAAGFFEKIIAENGGECGVSKYFSTHPCPSNRVQNINSRASSSGCSKAATDVETYANIKAKL
ncbi:MAG: M48 family metalloprotease [Cytophagales bacterium]